MFENLPESAVSERVGSRKKGVKAYAKNPFWVPQEVKVGKRRVTIAGGYVTNPGTGETLQHAGIHRVEFVDEEKFVKLFTQNLKVFFDLSPSSQKVLGFVLTTLQDNPNAEGIWLPWFDIEDYSKAHDLKISRTSFQRSLKEMLEKGFIAESERPNFYWINPHLFFNGDRMVFINEYRRETKAASEARKKEKAASNSDAADRDELEARGQMRLAVDSENPSS